MITYLSKLLKMSTYRLFPEKRPSRNQPLLQFPSLAELLAHSGIAAGELFNAEIIGFVVGQAEVIFRG